MKPATITVYGAQILCPSCVNLPSAKETYEWLEAAISRKYPNQPFTISYVDIHNPPNEEEKRTFAKKIIAEDLFYPLVLVEKKIIGEGNVRLKAVYEELESYGYKSE